MDIPKIQSTTKYNIFQHFIENRPISQKHVDALAQDPTFKTKFCTSPILVNSDFFIIDGQHRFRAAQKLNIPIYYIIDPEATEGDIRMRNSQMNNWKGIDYIHYFAGKNEDYKLLMDIRDKHKLTLSFINAAIIKICGYKHIKYTYMLKNGEVKIMKFKDILNEFFDSYVPSIKLATKVKGIKNTNALFLDSYITGFAHFFVNDRKLYDHALRKLCTCSTEFAHTSSFEKAREYITKISNWKKVKNSNVNEEKD